MTRYNIANAKKNGKVTAMKSGVDLVLGIGVGTALGAGFGLAAPFIGPGLIVLGHIIGDKTGVIRIAGASMTAYGIATAMANRAAADAASIDGVSLGSVVNGAKNRFVQFKDSWMHAFYVDKLINKDTATEITTDKEEVTVGAIDMSSLDVFDQLNKESAIEYESNQMALENETEEDQFSFDQEEEFEQSEEDFSELEEDIDLSTI